MTENKNYMTRQRQAILEELRKVTSHPGADEVYEMVRRRLPKISMGTVYRNLEQMAAEGLILKLDGGTQKRYDGNPRPHYHFRCLRCNVMIDLPFEPLGDIQKIIEKMCDFEVTGYELNFVGLCPICKKEAKRNGQEPTEDINDETHNR